MLATDSKRSPNAESKLNESVGGARSGPQVQRQRPQDPRQLALLPFISRAQGGRRRSKDGDMEVATRVTTVTISRITAFARDVAVELRGRLLTKRTRTEPWRRAP